MKLLLEHQIHIKASILKFVSEHEEEVKQYIVNAKPPTNPIATMWLLYNLSTTWGFKQTIYKYANDDHICTVLRKFWKENELLLRGE